MKRRCYDPKIFCYSNYGGRGIKVCDRWLESFENFRLDMEPTWKKGKSIDRIDNDGNYSPENCKWSTLKQQRKNQREHKVRGEIDLRGVQLDKRLGVYRAQINVRGKVYHLGHFNTAEEAAEAFKKAKKQGISRYKIPTREKPEPPAKGKVPYRGVYYDSRRNKYVAQKKRKFLGSFETAEEAAKAYEKN